MMDSSSKVLKTRQLPTSNSPTPKAPRDLRILDVGSWQLGIDRVLGLSLYDQREPVRCLPDSTSSSIQMLPVVEDIVNATRPFTTSIPILPPCGDTKRAGES